MRAYKISTSLIALVVVLGAPFSASAIEGMSTLERECRMALEGSLPPITTPETSSSIGGLGETSLTTPLTSAVPANNCPEGTRFIMRDGRIPWCEPLTSTVTGDSSRTVDPGISNVSGSVSQNGGETLNLSTSLRSVGTGASDRQLITTGTSGDSLREAALTTPVVLTPLVPETPLPTRDRFTDREVLDGVKAKLAGNSNLTEADIRSIAKDQYGITDAQLDRVRTLYYQEARVAEPARISQAASSQPDRFTDREVLDGVKAKLAGNPNLTEADIRSIAKQQYGVTDTQLDRVKEMYIQGQ